MAQTETIDTLVGKVQQRVGLTPDYYLVQDWLVNAFRDVMNRIAWTWRRRQGQMIFSAPITAGTVNVGRGDSLIVFNNSVMTPDMDGWQIRIGGNNTRISTLSYQTDAYTVGIDLPWGGAPLSNSAFEIYPAYHTVPEDFDSFISIVDLTRRFQLDWWSHTAEELDAVDPMRAYGGDMAYWVVLKDYGTADNQLLRYEPWPHVKVDEMRPYLYLAKLPDLTVAGTTLPRYVRSDVLVLLALAKCASWKNEKNAYYDLKLAMVHQTEAEEKLTDMEREDQARETSDLVYDGWASWPVGGAGFGSGDYAVGHDIGYD